MKRYLTGGFRISCFGFHPSEGAIRIYIDISDRLIQPFVRLAILYRRIRFGYPFRRIPLTQGKHAIVDPEDYQRLNKHKWFAIKSPNTYYVGRYSKRHRSKKRLYIKMHNEVIRPPKGLIIDHINNNPLDNRKVNLRIATPAQNARNRRKMTAKTSSKYKGVSYHSGQKKWCASIRVDGQYKYFGLFENETEAAKAYDNAARKFHKEFAVLNFDD